MLKIIKSGIQIFHRSRFGFLDEKLFKQDHYRILGLKPSATSEEIKKEYYKLTKIYHPDVNKGFEEKFKSINAAWGVLGDDIKRKEYDAYKGFINLQNQNTPPNPSQQRQTAGHIYEAELIKLANELQSKGMDIEDFKLHPSFKEFQSAFGINPKEPTSITERISQKVKLTALNFLLQKVQDIINRQGGKYNRNHSNKQQYYHPHVSNTIFDQLGREFTNLFKRKD